MPEKIRWKELEDTWIPHAVRRKHTQAIRPLIPHVYLSMHVSPYTTCNKCNTSSFTNQSLQCVCMLVHACECMCVCVDVCLCLVGLRTSERSKFGVFFYWSQPIFFFFETEHLSEPWACQFNLDKGHQALWLCVSLSAPVLGLQKCTTMLTSYMSTGYLNSGLHVWIESTIPTKSSLQLTDF